MRPTLLLLLLTAGMTAQTMTVRRVPGLTCDCNVEKTPPAQTGKQPAKPNSPFCDAQHPCNWADGEDTAQICDSIQHPECSGGASKPPMDEKWIMDDLPSQAKHNYEFRGAGLTGYISVATPESTVVKLSDEEYSKLIALRQAVVNEEKRLAVKYGAYLSPPSCAAGTACFSVTRGLSDAYTFHGQFLLIDKAAPSGLVINRFPYGSVPKGNK